MEKYRIISLVLAIFSGFLLIKLLINDNPESNQSIIIKKDTVIVRQNEIIKIDKIVPKIVFVRDTIIETKPFVATIDTVIKRDTVLLRYDFPENLFSMKVTPAIDSIKIEKIYEYKERELSWYERATLFAAGFGIAFLISK